MPNWCENELAIRQAKAGELKKFIEFIKLEVEPSEYHGDFKFTFGTVVPRPSELDIKCPPHTEEERERAKRNKERFGYVDWYAFNIVEWGTKWEPGEVRVNNCLTIEEVMFIIDGMDKSVHPEDDYFTIMFDTAWSPPVPWLHKAGIMFPQLKFRLRYREEGMAFAGTATAYGEDNTDDCYKLPDESYFWGEFDHEPNKKAEEVEKTTEK